MNIIAVDNYGECIEQNLKKIVFPKNACSILYSIIPISEYLMRQEKSAKQFGNNQKNRKEKKLKQKNSKQYKLYAYRLFKKHSSTYKNDEK